MPPCCLRQPRAETGTHRPRPRLPPTRLPPEPSPPTPAAWLPSNRPAHTPQPAGQGHGSVGLPLFSSVLPRAGCTGAAGGGGRGSSRWAGTAAAAPPASGVKERPWHPSPQGSVSSTLGSRVRPAPTRADTCQTSAGAACPCPRGCLRLRQGLALPRKGAEEETDRASGSRERDLERPGWGRKWAWRGSWLLRAPCPDRRGARRLLARRPPRRLSCY